MVSNPIWSEFQDGCRVLAAMVQNDPDPEKQAARAEARKTIRLALKMKLAESGAHFSDGAANEMISMVARSHVQNSAGFQAVISDESLGLT